MKLLASCGSPSAAHVVWLREGGRFSLGWIQAIHSSPLGTRLSPSPLFHAPHGSMFKAAQQLLLKTLVHTSNGAQSSGT